jgi:hypothetical protein
MLWREDAQLHHADGREMYRKERWDFATAQESIDDLVKKVTKYLRSKEQQTGGA